MATRKPGGGFITAITAKNPSKQVKGFLVAVLWMACAGVAQADITSTAHIYLGPVLPGSVPGVPIDLTDTSVPNVQALGNATFTYSQNEYRSVSDSSGGIFLVLDQVSSIPFNGQATAVGLTQYGAIHGSVSATSSPYAYLNYINGTAVLPIGPTPQYGGVMSQATFVGRWSDNWTISGIPSGCNSVGTCSITVSGHLQYNSALFPSPGLPVADPTSASYGAGFEFQMQSGAWNGYGHVDATHASNSGSHILLYENSPTPIDLGNADGNHTINWIATLPIVYTGSTSSAISVRSFLNLAAFGSATLDASDTGAIDNIILPTGVTLAADSGQLTTLPNGRLTYIAAVPEPEQYALMLAGLGLLAGLSRRKAKRNTYSSELI